MNTINLLNETEKNTKEVFPFFAKQCQKMLLKKSLIKSSKWKRAYSKISNDFKNNNSLKVDNLFKPIINDPNLLSMNFWFYGLEVTYTDIHIYSIPYMNPSKIYKDKKFLGYYMKILASLSILENKTNSLDDAIRVFFGSLQRVIMTYFLLNEKNITTAKARKLLSFIYNEDSLIEFSNTNSKIDSYINQIISGVKEVVIKDNLIENTNKNTEKRKDIDILTSINNSIRIKYQTTKQGKHLNHKSPICHVRKSHIRTLKMVKLFM